MAILEDISKLLEESGIYAEGVTKDLCTKPNDFRSMCFWNIHNRIKITEEILGFYNSSWSLNRVEVSEEKEGEMLERIVTITRDMFVDVVSSIEKSSKDAVEFYSKSNLKEAALENRNYLYLRNIIEASWHNSLISENTFNEWEGILVMRNLVAHNNSMSDRAQKYEVGGIAISMRPGRMMKGPLDTFVVLTQRILSLYFDWIYIMDGNFGGKK